MTGKLLELATLRALLERATPVPWQLQDGCSWRRIGTPFSDGAVLCPGTYSREDRHPDLTAKDGRLYDNLRLIVEGINTLPDLLSTIERQAEEIAGLRAALEPFAAKCALVDVTYDEDYTPDWSPFIEVRHYRNARAALASQKDSDRG